MAVRIDGGCTQIASDTWKYIVQSNDNPGGIIYVFTAHQTPQLGDEIDGGVLVPRETTTDKLHGLDNTQPEYIINNDPGFQAKGKVDRVDIWGRDELPK